MESLQDPNEKIMCPYNPAHHILRGRMHSHLVKCKKSYPNSKLVECDFNVNHKIAKPELHYHHENCPDRCKIEVAIYPAEGTKFNRFPVPNIKVPTEESWDEYDVPTYNPQKYCENNNILRHIDVESASTRTNFRMSERRRVNDLNVHKSKAKVIQSKEPKVDASVGLSRKNFPDRPTISTEEDSPDIVSLITEKLEHGKNKVYVSK